MFIKIKAIICLYISNLTLSLSNYKKGKLFNFKGVRFEDSGL